GLPIKSAQDWALGMDVHPGERVMWITDMGWVMGPLLVFGSLMLGGTAVFYDGAPDHPNPARVWAVAERQGVTHLGISPTLTRVLMASGERAVPPTPISALRVLASTGEPWTPEAWTWLFSRRDPGVSPGPFPASMPRSSTNRVSRSVARWASSWFVSHTWG
ncbi:MAG: hypothetical protein E6I68_12730, partial [Chloroflexi bacterium]